jgi:hypothetical protein
MLFPPVRLRRLRAFTALEHDTRERGKLHCGIAPEGIS